ncbi:hypothetical protein [Saccharopolyspora sp. 5N708]|uniref:hypothetical protein n=1 Tax=Saccharopolyspora sp. 5N708 TaxID=3457424 RepID=UPI003FCFA8D7
MSSSPATPPAGLSRRNVLRTTVAAGVAGTAALAAACAPAAARAAARPAPGGRSGVRLRWLGLAGWEITSDDHRLLVDPYLTRQ